MNRIPILIAEANDAYREMLVTAVNVWGYAPIAVSNGTAALDVLNSDSSTRLGILDWVIPDLNGPEICRRVRNAMFENYTYLLLLTERTDQRDRLAGLESGADDFITKPFYPDELRLRLRAGSRVLDLQDRLKIAHDVLKHQASSDSLTGVFNRDTVIGALEREVNRAQREQTSLGVMMIDVDHLKQLNEKFGPPVGDRALQELASTLKNSTRPYDSCGRYGADEFLVVFPNSDLKYVARIAQRVRQLLFADGFQYADQHTEITISVGIAASQPERFLNAEQLINAADDALYQAKRDGCDRIVRFDRLQKQTVGSGIPTC